MDEIKLDLSIIKQDLQKLCECTAAEHRITDLEDTCAPLPQTLQNLHKDVTACIRSQTI